MKTKFKALFVTLQPWQIILLATVAAVLVTNIITVVVSTILWQEIQTTLLTLGTINAILVPLIVMPGIIRVVRRVIRLDEQQQFHHEMLLQLEKQKEVETEIQRRADEMALLYQLNVALTSGQDLYHALRAFVKELKRVMIVDAFHVGLYEELTDMFTYKLFLNLDEDLQILPRKLSAYPGLTWEVVSGRRTLYVPDITAPAAQRQHNIVIVVDVGMRSYVGIPLVLRERVVGVMSVQSMQVDAYSSDQIRALETIAAQVATTIEKADLLEQLTQELAERRLVESALQHSALRLELSHDIDRALLSVQSLDQIATNALAGIRKLIPCRRASITLFDHETQQAMILAINTDDLPSSPYGLTIPFSEYGEYILEKLHQNQACFVDDLLLEPRATNWDRNLAEDGFRTWLYLPLLYQGQLIGSLNLARDVSARFTQADAELGYDITNPLAIAIRQARLTDALQAELGERKQVEASLRQRETILEAVTFAAEQFLKTTDWRTNIDGALEQLGKAIHATHAYLFEDHLNPDGQLVTSMRYEWTAPGYQSDLDGPYFQSSLVHQAGFEEQVEKLKRGEVRSGTSSTFNPIEKRAMDDLGVKAILEVPIFVNSKEWGAMGFDDFEREREWSPAEVDALRIAAGVLSAAIQRQQAESAVRESERIYRLAIETGGAVPYYEDYQLKEYKFVGDGIQKILGYTADEMSVALWSALVEKMQLIGELADLDLSEAIRRLRSGEVKYWKSDNLVRAKDGQLKWIADTAVELYDENGKSYGSLGILQDITERKFIEARLREREAILEAVAVSAERLFSVSEWRLELNGLLEKLGKSINASHAYLFENRLTENGAVLTTMVFEWTAPHAASDLGQSEFIDKFIDQDDLSSWYQQMKLGQPFIGDRDHLTQEDIDYLQERGILALLDVPIYIDQNWWGILGFDDMTQARTWTNAEVDALKIAAGILSAAIQRQRSESAVRESERIYRQAIGAAGAVAYVRNYRENRYTFIGSNIEQMIGYKPEEINVELWLKIMQENVPLGEGENLPIAEAVQSSRAGQFKTWRSDMRVIAKDGEEHWITDSAVELFDEAEFSYASVGILQDVTDRKRTEVNLRKRESLLATSTFAADQFLKVPDWRSTIQAVLERVGREINASHAYLFEKHRDAHGEILNSLRYEWVAPGQKPDMDNLAYQDAPMNEADFKQYYEVLNSGEPFVGHSSYFRTAENEKVWMQETGIKALLEMRIVVDGEQWGTLGFDEMMNEREWTSMEVDLIRVVTGVLGAAIKRQQDEAALQKELDVQTHLIEELEIRNAESETLRETTVIVTSTLNVSEAVRSILEQLKRVVAYDSASVWLYQGNKAFMIGDDGLPETVDKNKSYTLSVQEPDFPLWKQEVPYVLMADIQADYPRFRVPPIDYIHGWLTIPLKVRGVMTGFISLDGRRVDQFTERDAELALNYANQVSIALENARLFSELQSELAERQRLINELESKNSELERFTYTVSHDLKSPLVTINGFLGYLERDAAAGDMVRMRQDAQRIHEAVKKMQSLLNELLELSRIGRMMNTPQTFAFDTLVKEALDVVHGQLNRRNITVQTQPNLPMIYGDKPRLLEVMQNLVDNAAKYMGVQPEPQIEIGQRGFENEQPIFFVKDNGMGIDPEFHERIFGLFNKLDPNSEGTGVGLALVRRIIEVHGGRIWVESEPGSGSTFLFTLPTQPKTDSVL